MNGYEWIELEDAPDYPVDICTACDYFQNSGLPLGDCDVAECDEQGVLWVLKKMESV